MTSITTITPEKRRQQAEAAEAVRQFKASGKKIHKVPEGVSADHGQLGKKNRRQRRAAEQYNERRIKMAMEQW